MIVLSFLIATSSVSMRTSMLHDCGHLDPSYMQPYSDNLDQKFLYAGVYNTVVLSMV